MVSRFHGVAYVLGLMLLIGCSEAVELGAAQNCEGLKGCKQKICNLKNDVIVAKKMGNDNRVDGLSISLKKVQKHCTDKGLVKDVEDKISGVKKDLKEDTVDYEEALRDARPDKIKKYKAKMAEELKELKELEAELKELKAS